MSKQKKSVPTEACWSCQRVNPLNVLPGVRLTKCPGCGAIHPSLTSRLVRAFYNEEKQVFIKAA